MHFRSATFLFGCAMLGACAQGGSSSQTAMTAPPAGPPSVGTAMPSPTPPAAMAAATPGASSTTAGGKACQTGRRFDQDGFHLRMRVSNAGGPCSASTMFQLPGGKTGNTSEVVPTSGSISSPPAHGTANLVFNAGDSSVVYTPTPGYTGADHFEFRVIPSTRLWEVAVTVTP